MEQILPGQMWVPATITRLEDIVSRELRIVEITLPSRQRINGRWVPVNGSMSIGGAFCVQSFGMSSGKFKLRWYSRSNYPSSRDWTLGECDLRPSRDPLELQTIINKKDENPDTSLWWQSWLYDDSIAPQNGDRILVHMQLKDGVLHPSEPQIKKEEQSLVLEIPSCFKMRYVGLGFYTGVAPLLAHVRFLATSGFGPRKEAQYTLIVSVRSPEFLMFHTELLRLTDRFPKNFHYFPVATREWDDAWPYSKGRIMSAKRDSEGTLTHVDLEPLLKLIPDLGEHHIRLCGGKEPRDWLQFGLKKHGITPPSFKSEVW